jgi:hypothetical protein
MVVSSDDVHSASAYKLYIQGVRKVCIVELLPRSVVGSTCPDSSKERGKDDAVIVEPLAPLFVAVTAMHTS